MVDVNTAVAQAVSYFDSLGNANRTQAVVFDIDETALSNLPVSEAISVQHTRVAQMTDLSW